MTNHPSPDRIAGLDGLRTIAITLVLAQHLQIAQWIEDYPSELGRLGVALFFALSGYLITGILLNKPTRLLHFYWRRSLRIFPAFYTYLAVTFGTIALGWQSASPTAMLTAATYSINFYHEWRGWSLQHLWSLAVEEQFYLCWPPILKSVGQRWAGIGLLVILFGWPLQRYLRTNRWGHPDIEAALFAVTFDAIFWGCLAAIYYSPPRERPWLTGQFVFLLPTLAIAALYSHAWEPPTVLVPWVRNASLAWIVLWVSHNSHHILVRCLEWRPVRWLGVRSYSVYLWHILFLDPRLKAWLNWPTAVALGLFFASLSYRWVETPILAWRDRRKTT